MSEAPPRLEPADAPFDQYERYAVARDVAQAMAAQGGLPAVLDVGGHHLDFWSRARRPIAEFLPACRTVTLDLAVNPLPGYVRGRGDALPFAGGSFDLVCSVDVLEHVPEAARPAVIAQAARVARRATLIAAPFATQAVERAESLVAAFIRDVCGYEQGQLREHRERGLPDLARTARLMEAGGWTVRVFGYGNVFRWALMMVDKHALAALTGSRRAHVRLDRQYNERHAAGDGAAPCYRHFLLATRDARDPLLAWAERRFNAAPIDDWLAVPPAGALLVEPQFDLLAIHAGNQAVQVRAEPERRTDHIRDVELHRDQALAALASQQAEASRLEALLHEVERSPAFRVTALARRVLRLKP